MKKTSILKSLCILILLNAAVMGFMGCRACGLKDFVSDLLSSRLPETSSHDLASANLVEEIESDHLGSCILNLPQKILVYNPNTELSRLISKLNIFLSNKIEFNTHLEFLEDTVRVSTATILKSIGRRNFNFDIYAVPPSVKCLV